MTDLQQGRLEQVCPACGLREAAGHYCSACLRKTGADYWRKNVRTDAQRASCTSRHSTPQVAATATKTALPAPLATANPSGETLTVSPPPSASLQSGPADRSALAGG